MWKGEKKRSKPRIRMGSENRKSLQVHRPHLEKEVWANPRMCQKRLTPDYSREKPPLWSGGFVKRV